MASGKPAARLWAVSDIHVDYPENMAWIQALSRTAYQGDTLILAGDVSDDLPTLEAALRCLQQRFAQVVFVPGNHELWVRRQSRLDSPGKFQHILALCAALGVATTPVKIAGALWIVPLFSWYVRPEEGADSLYVPKASEKPALTRWSDDFFTRWPAGWCGRHIADYFFALNIPHLHRHYDAPIVSCSHFLPRTDLMLPTPEERALVSTPPPDSTPYFNFSRVAGSSLLETQIRQLGAAIHVYGHQHRNRRRLVDGICYIAHSLGYQRERERGQIRGIEHGPALLWELGSTERRPENHESYV